MKYRKFQYSILVFAAVLFILLYAISFMRQKNTFMVNFLNVGQGDAILISQGNTQVLIDGGKDGKLLLEKLGSRIPFWDRTIETIIVTHPDQDHIGGLLKVLQTYKVETIMQTTHKSDSQTYEKLQDLVRKNHVENIDAMRDVVLHMHEAQIKILYPLGSLREGIESNATSVVSKIEYGENSFLMTGDLPSEQEAELIKSGLLLEADVLKISHHGSKYSSSQEFLKSVKAADAVISVGKNNTYGHPHQDVMQRLKDLHMNILRTDEKGDIVYRCENPQSRCILSN